VIRSETDFALVLYRTQLFNPGDIENVKKIQAGYKVQTFSEFLGKPAPAAPPAVDFMKPLTADQERTSLQFFNVLNFVLQFCPTHPSEKALMAPHWSFILCVSFFGQPAVISASQSITFASRPRLSIRRSAR
jgi:hypothetical protein